MFGDGVRAYTLECVAMMVPCVLWQTDNRLRAQFGTRWTRKHVLLACVRERRERETWGQGRVDAYVLVAASPLPAARCMMPH